MYQALYRKYRPKTFDDVVGQDVVIRTLINSINSDKINHAYLFSGPRGSGKTSIAKIFARTINCENITDAKPCNNCVFCTQINDQNMDIIEIDAASNNGVDEIREINNKVNLVPSLGRYKVYIIDEVHMLTIGAFNALLKTLEEPPKHVIFILATTDPQKVPMTILSRCQKHDFKKISESKIQERLKYIVESEKIKITDESIKEIARLGDGSLRDAISILDQSIAYSDGEITIDDVHDVNGSIPSALIRDLIVNIIDKDINNVMNIIDDYSNKGKSIIKITEEIIVFLRNLLLDQISSNNKTEINQLIINKIPNEKLLEYIQNINQSLSDMKKFANPKLILELGLIKILNDIGLGNNDRVNFVQTSTIDVKQDANQVPIKQEPTVQKVIENNVNNSKTSISQEIKINDDLTKILKTFIDTRVSNALAHISKKLILEIDKELNRINEYLLDEKFGYIAAIILDGKIKVASEEYLVFLLKTSNQAYEFNENIILIEELLNNVLNHSYKVVAVDNDEWEVIKTKFNNKQQVFSYEEEKINISDLISLLHNNDNDGLENLFGELVEYN